MAIKHLSHIGPSDSATTVSVAGTAPCCRSSRSRRGSHSAASLPIIKHRQVLQSRMSCLQPRANDCRASRVTTVNGGRSSCQLVAGLGLAVETRAAFGTSPIAQGRNIGSIGRADCGQFAAALATRALTESRGENRDHRQHDGDRQYNSPDRKDYHEHAPGRSNHRFSGLLSRAVGVLI